VYETCLKLSTPISFVSNSAFEKLKTEYDNAPEILCKYRVGDDNIKSKCRDEAFMNAFISLMIDNFTDTKCDIREKQNDDTVMSILPYIFKTYERTGNTKDVISFAHIRDGYLKYCGSDISSQKLTNELKKDFIIKRRNIGMVLTGFKLKEDDAESAEEEEQDMESVET